MYNLNFTKEEYEFLKMLLYREYIDILDNTTMLEWAKDLKLKEYVNLLVKINKAKEN